MVSLMSFRMQQKLKFNIELLLQIFRFQRGQSSWAFREGSLFIQIRIDR